MKPRDLTNITFANLTVTGASPTKGYWFADCSCGTKHKQYRGSSLISGNTKSCGCLRLNNVGRPKLRKPNQHRAFIPFDDMLLNCVQHLTPIRNYLKTKGVTVTKDSYIFVGGVRSGPYKSAFHALSAAIDKCVLGMGE